VGRKTAVIVTNNTGKEGVILLVCGLSSGEQTVVLPGRTELDRNFGGFPLDIYNKGNGALTVETQ
jgi:hypothetical protein